MEWKPIETAPKDGTEIILGFNADWYGWQVNMKSWNSEKEMWWGDCCGLLAEPTHWMPLPSPPEVTK